MADLRRFLRSIFASSPPPHTALTLPSLPEGEPPQDIAPSLGAPGPMPAESASPTPSSPYRPLEPRIGDALQCLPVTVASVTEMMTSPACEALTEYFHEYPPTSLMGDKSRAMLFALVRMLRPEVAAEIGTYHAGGAEVIARALQENGGGFLHTADPFGADRCPAIFASWPGELRRLVEFHPLNSMDFVLKLHHRGIALDFVLVDGDHDYEFALFDLQMAARLLRPGGVVVMNDSVQTGPFQAARTFLAANPAWQELGTAVATFDENRPFAGGRASQAGTGFVVLQAPQYWSISARPQSWGQASTAAPLVAGLALDALPQTTAGTLHYQAILRMFGDGSPREAKKVGAIPVLLEGSGQRLMHKLDHPMAFEMPVDTAGITSTFEIELSWCAAPGSPPLALGAIPAPFAPCGYTNAR